MNGIIVLDKPQGFTSFDAVAKLRVILHTKKIGHGGTLDPMATGVLPIFVGNATRAVDLVPDSPKCYTATARLGILTDTGDITGTVTRCSDYIPSLDELTAACAKFIGKIEQIPPMYSAIKVGGRKLYDIARSGKTVERQPRSIEIHSLYINDYNIENKEFSFTVSCSKGTYVRTLSEDIASACSSLATLTSLRRTESGGFTLSDCMSFNEIEKAVNDSNYSTDSNNLCNPEHYNSVENPNCFQQNEQLFNNTDDERREKSRVTVVDNTVDKLKTVENSIFRNVDSVFLPYPAITLTEVAARRYLSGAAFEREILSNIDPYLYPVSDDKKIWHPFNSLQYAEYNILRVYYQTTFLGLAEIKNDTLVKLKQFYSDCI